MKVGDKFSDYAELTSKLKSYEKENYVKFWMRSSRKLAAAKKRYPKRAALAKPELIYYEIKFCCIHGGPYHTQAKRVRKTRTFRNDCQSYFNVKMSDDGSSLEITHMNENHNHEISKELFQTLPHQRKSSEYFQEKAATLMDLDAHKEKVQQLNFEADQTIFLRDLTNIYQLKNYLQIKNTLNKTISELESKWHANIEIYTDSTNVLRGLFFQDNEMKRLFQCYPEFIFCEVTHKFLDLNLPCYFMAVEDSNGESEIICIGILVNDDLESFEWLLDTFKKHNERFNNVRVIMSDKDFKNISFLKNAFPSAKLVFSIFHTVQIFRKDISYDNMNISYLERVSSLEMLQKMIYSKTETDYNNIYEEFSKSVPTEILNYFNINWHLIRYKWVLGISCTAGIIFETTYNRIESLNTKLKTVINQSSTLAEFIDSFFLMLNILRKQKDHKAINLYLKRPSRNDNALRDKQYYQSVLTPYAFKFIEKQFALLAYINDDDINENGDEFIIKSNKEFFTFTEDSCTCSFRNTMHLPCCHILALRRKKSLSTFSENLCDSRWFMQYYKSCQRMFLNDDFILPKENKLQSLLISNKPQEIAKTAFERYMFSFSLAKEVLSFASTNSSDKFNERFELLKSLLDKWKDGNEINIVPLDIENKSLSELPSRI